MATSSAWSPERRARQAAAIQRWRPWEKSTGPRTVEGKAKSSRNAYAGDVYHNIQQQLRETRTLSQLLFRK